MTGDKCKLILINLKKQLEKIHCFLTIAAGGNTNKITTLSLAIDNPPLNQSLWIPQKSNSNEFQTFTSLVEKVFFQDTSRKRIPSNLSQDEKKALKNWRKSVLLRTRTRLCLDKTKGMGSLLLINKQIVKKAMCRLKGVPF